MDCQVDEHAELVLNGNSNGSKDISLTNGDDESEMDQFNSAKIISTILDNNGVDGSPMDTQSHLNAIKRSRDAIDDELTSKRAKITAEGDGERGTPDNADEPSESNALENDKSTAGNVIALDDTQLDATEDAIDLIPELANDLELTSDGGQDIPEEIPEKEIQELPTITNDYFAPKTLFDIINEAVETTLNGNAEEGISLDINNRPSVSVVDSSTTNKVPEECEEKDEAPESMVKGSSLDFLHKFKTNFQNISRSDLEELVLEKMIEALLFKSKVAENAQRIAEQDRKLALMRDKMNEAHKLFRTLKHMYKDVEAQMEEHNVNGCKVEARRITRTVGIQTQSIDSIKCRMCGNKTSVISNLRNDTDKRQSRSEGGPSVVAEQQIPMPVEQTVARKSPEATTEAVNGGEGNSEGGANVVDLTEDEEVGEGQSQVLRVPGQLVALPMRTADNSTSVSHPAPLPPSLRTNMPAMNPYLKKPPPVPNVKVRRCSVGIVLSWTVDLFLSQVHAEIREYQLYGYHAIDQTPSSKKWKSLGVVKALKLPMAITLTQFQKGPRYYFCVRARDIHNRYGPFSPPTTWI